jgi:hypothetical protein
MTPEPDGTLTLHKHCYVAIVPSGDVDAMLRDLRELGISQDAIDAFCDSEADANFEALSPQRFETNSLQTLVRRVLGLDQVEVEQEYVEALRAGEPVVRVHVPEKDHDTRGEVERTLLAHGGRYIHYFGEWSYAEVAAAADRPGESA